MSLEECASMLFSSRNVSGARTVHFPRDFSVKCQPMMSAPVSEDGRCLVGPEVLVGTAIRLAWLSLARKVLRRVKASRSWARASGTSVVSATMLMRSVSAKS